MNGRKTISFASRRPLRTGVLVTLLFAGAAVVSSFLTAAGAAQTIERPAATSIFRIGEKLSYNISFGKFHNAGYAETYVASRGKLSGHDAVELRSKVKTLEIVSAAFFFLDQTRTVYAAPDTGLPIYIRSNDHNSALPKETVNNYLDSPSTSYDLLSLIYKARESGGSGTFSVTEGERTSTVTFLPTTSERIKTDAGEFDTTISAVQGEILAANGINELKINFSNDDARIPVLVRFKTSKGPLQATLSSISLADETNAAPGPTLVPAPSQTPTPRPAATPLPYVENRPLAPELGFDIGESLTYRISLASKPVATMVMAVPERKMFQGHDALLLTATITSIEPGSNIFIVGDGIRAEVDPETLSPLWVANRVSGSNFGGLKQTLTFDQRTGKVTFGGPIGIDAPIGTHTLLSLIYAARSFNLKPSKDLSNPVNDTRVAVFWEDKAYIFTLRPGATENIVLNGDKVPAQQIAVNTGNPQLDALAIKVWVAPDTRIPLRFSAGAYQADLIRSKLQ